MSEAFQVPEPSDKAVGDAWRVLQPEMDYAVRLFGKPSYRLLDHFVQSALRAGMAVDVPGIVREEVARALLWRSQQEHGVESACLGPEDYAYLARFGCPHDEILMCAGGPCKRCGFLTSPEAAPETCEHQWATETTTFGKTKCVKCGKVLRDPLSFLPPEVQEVCGAVKEPYICTLPLGHTGCHESWDGDKCNRIWEGPVPTPRGAPEPKQCVQCRKWFVPNLDNAGMSCLVSHNGSCCHFSDIEVPTPSAPAEPKIHLEKGNVVWRKPPAHLAGTAWMDCHSCPAVIQINAADLAEGLRVAGSVPEEPLFCTCPTASDAPGSRHTVECAYADVERVTRSARSATADLARIGSDFDAAAAMKASAQFVAERDFLRALAKWWDAEGLNPTVRAAARAVVEVK